MAGSQDLAADRALTDALGSVLHRWMPTGGAVNGQRDALWRDLTSGGWLDLFTLGLSGDTAVSAEAAVAAAEQFGAHLAPQTTVVAGGFLVPLLWGLTSCWPVAEGLRDRLGEGELMAVPLPRVKPDTGAYAFTGSVRGEPAGQEYRLTGQVSGYLDLQHARSVLVPVFLAEQATGLALVDLAADGVRAERRKTIVPDLEVGELDLGGTVVDSELVLTQAVDDVVRTAGAQWSLALDAYAVGIAAAVLERTLSHVKDREQFGRPIGTFQAIQHQIADMDVALETSRSLLSAAARKLQQEPEISPALMADIFASRLYCAETAKTVCESAIQVHGGAGFTWELGLHYWYRAAMFARQYCTDHRGIRTALAHSLRETARQRGEQRAETATGGTL